MTIFSFRRWLFIVCVWSISHHLQAQPQSRHNTWPGQLSDYIEQIKDNPSAVVETVTQSLSQLLDTPEKAASYAVLCRANSALLNNDAAMFAAEQGLTLIRRENHPWLYHQLVLCKASVLDDGSLPTQAKSLTLPAINWANANQANELLTYALLTDGLVDLSLRDVDNALVRFQEGYRIAQQHTTSQTTADFATLIAAVYEYQGDLQGALPFLQEAEHFYRAQPARLRLAAILYDLGRINIELTHTDLGLKQIRESANLALDVGNLQAAAYGYQELAEYLVDQNNTETAESFLQEALSIFESADNRAMQISVLLSLSKIDKQRNDSAAALLHLDRAHKIATDNNVIPAQLEINDRKAELLALNGAFEQAYDLMLVNLKLGNQLYKNENSQRLLELQTRFEVEQEKIKNDLLREQNLRQQSQLERDEEIRQYAIVVGLLLLLVIALLGYLYINTQRHRARLEKLANQDDLTGLMSRRNIMERLEHQLALARRIQAPLTVAVVDLDHFKRINDNFGHATGDAVLREFGQLAQRCFRISDGLGRVGGEEFLFYFPHTASVQAYQLLERFAKKVYTIPDLIGQPEVSVSLSAGIAQVSENDEVRTVIAKADKALYRAKENGRNRIERATDE